MGSGGVNFTPSLIGIFGFLMSRSMIKRFWVLFWGMIPLVAVAQNPVKWQLSTDKTAYFAGQTVQIQIRGTIESGWHVYAMGSPAGRPLSVKWQNTSGLLMPQGTFSQSGQTEMYDPNFESNVLQWEHEASVSGKLTIAPEASEGEQTISVEVAFMTCNDRMCLPVRKIPLSATIQIKKAKTAVPPVKSDSALTKPPKLSWKTQILNTTVIPNGLIQVQFETALPSGWKLYASDSKGGMPLRITSSAPEFALVPPLKDAETHTSFDQTFNSNVTYWTNRVQSVATFRVGQTVSGTLPLKGSIRFMVCSENVCVPQNASFETSVAISKSGVANQGTITPPASGVQPPSTLDQAKSGGFWSFLLLALGAALAALLTPCVFPMIPLTVSYFTKFTEHPVRSALVYGFSIIGTFTGLGLLMALIAGAAGAQTVASNPWVNLLIGLIFIVFAFSLLGFYEITLPNGLVNYFNQQGNARKGTLGIVFMGFTLTLVSFSCTVPFVGGLLAATVRGEWFWPILGMLAFSTTFALPFVLFALFPRALNALPRSGSWMNTVKVVLGFVELAAALKFLSNADLVWGTNWLSRSLAIGIVMFVFSLIVLYLWGLFRLPHDTPAAKISWGRWVISGIFAGLVAFMGTGITGKPLGLADAYLPPVATHVASASTQKTDASPQNGLLWWANQGRPADQAKVEAFKAASASGKPVFIDFTGYTCTNCRQMEASVFPEKAVESRFKSNFVLLRLYTDDDLEGPALQDYQLRLTGTVALPTYAIVSADGRLIRQLNGLVSAETFLAFLDGKS